MPAKANAFGEVRAEQDHDVLKNSFYEWQDYKSLFESTDRFIVVGRRGTGKSALTFRLQRDWYERKYTTIVIAPKEEEMIGLRPIANLFGNSVSRIRAGIKIAWRYAMLMEMGLVLLDHYKARHDLEARRFLHEKITFWRSYGSTSVERLRTCVKAVLKDVDLEEERIADLANLLSINRISDEIIAVVQATGRKFVILIDRLDEGYEPDSVGIGLVDGIIYGLDELRLALGSDIRVLVFVRDNIFRAIQVEDKDFSRNLEAQVLRLHWDQQELFYMVAKRIRNIFNITLESDVKTWNSITSNELHGREGFKRCLKLTLYRPRDVIALLNTAYYQAQRQQRTTLIQEDFAHSAKHISQTRYDDLGKEYESVIPGVGLLTGAFTNGSAKISWTDASQKIEPVMLDPNQREEVVQNFKILRTPDEAIKSLYGIGFFGIYDKQSGNYIFSHDGKSPSRTFGEADFLMIHPCYWAAMNIGQDGITQEDAEEIYDEYEITIASQGSEQRSKLLGQLISQLNSIPVGLDSAHDFEDWCKRAIEIAFARQLSNIQLRGNLSAVQRRDIIGTNEATGGFWRKIKDDYNTRQVIFEVKNYESIGIDEYRQVHSYLGREYGSLAFIICRDKQGAVSKGRELEAFREFYQKGCVIVKLTADFLVTTLSKLRSPEKFDAGSNLLDRILDTHVRIYASGQSDVVSRKAANRPKKK